MNWISHWKKNGIKVKQILKKQPVGQQETDWKNCPQCKKISYLTDLIANSYICECSFHFDLHPKLRLDSLLNSDYEIIEASTNINPDPLNFEVKDTAGKGYKYIDKIKKLARGKYVVIGFGITEKTIASLRESDGLVVGSACCKAITNSIKKRHNPVITIRNMVKNLRRKIR